jgi:HTH-type transcriptional regulator/antitoxin MqsA
MNTAVSKFQPEACPICGDGVWRPMSDGVHKFRHKRNVFDVSGMHYALCDKCGSKGFLPGQAKANRQLIAAFQEGIKEFIAPSEILAVREKYLLTQEQAGRIFGGGSQAFSKWEHGKVTPAEPTAKLLKLVLRSEEAMRELAIMAGETLPKIEPRCTSQDGNPIRDILVVKIETSVAKVGNHGHPAPIEFFGGSSFTGRVLAKPRVKKWFQKQETYSTASEILPAEDPNHERKVTYGSPLH